MSERRLPPVPPLSRAGLDRDAGTRATPVALAAASAEPGARFLLLWGGRAPVRRRNHALGPQLALLSAQELPEPGHLAPHYYLGRTLPETAQGASAEPGAPVFAVHLVEEPESTLPDGAEWAMLRDLSAEFSALDASIAVTALALARWHESEQFSPETGAPSEVRLGGWARVDSSTDRELFPRTDPAVIVLITQHDRVLLGSNALWESNRFSLLAGFVEAGESAEAAVVREVYEESGLLVSNVRYRVSQPWPFPRSLMLGFTAEPAPGVDPDALVADPTEIAELRWCTREELRSGSTGILLPGPASIARVLLDEWLDEDNWLDSGQLQGTDKE